VGTKRTLTARLTMPAPFRQSRQSLFCTAPEKPESRDGCVSKMLSLQLQKSPTPDFEEKCGISADISKGISQLGMCKFESSEVSQAVWCFARLPKNSANGLEMTAFGAVDFVSGLPNRHLRGANRRKSPAVRANIPILQRLAAETAYYRDCRPHVAVKLLQSPV
jgi:hypothetical protein